MIVADEDIFLSISLGIIWNFSFQHRESQLKLNLEKGIYWLINWKFQYIGTDYDFSNHTHY